MPVVPSSAYATARSALSLVRSLLNDIGLPGLPLPLARIERAANLVTVTTLGPHSLILNDQVAIAGAPAATPDLNGTFYVSAAVNSTQFTYAQVGADLAPVSGSALDGATSTAIGLGNVYTDSVLLPFLNSAYRVVQRALAMVGQATFKVDFATFIVPSVSNPFAAPFFPNGPDAGAQIYINDSTAPPNNIPVDLLEPLALWERPCQATTDVSQPLILMENPAAGYTEMRDLTESGGLPSLTQSESLRMWEWRTDGIYFLGAVQDVQVRMRYRKSLPLLADGTSQILIRNSEEAVAYLTAALAANSRGSSLADKYDAAGDEAIQKLISAATRQAQRTVRRRRPYRARRGVSGGFYF